MMKRQNERETKENEREACGNGENMRNMALTRILV
jgi:hypothetical protein